MSAFLKLLRPGLYVKRWFVVLLAGMVLVSLGFGYVLTEFYRSVSVPDWVGLVTLQFFPLVARAALFLVLGGAVCGIGLVRLYRSLDDVLPAYSNQSLLERIYEYRLRQGGPRIVCIGGGTGMPAVLRGLKHYSANITAIVTVGDDGGSSGRLRREHGIMPPGDFRNNIIALAEVEPLMARLFQYRFAEGSVLGGHSFGNLFVLAMTGVTGSFEHALRETSRVLAVQGVILPSTPQDVEICAEFTDGSIECGESRIPEIGKPIERLRIKPEHPAAQPEAVRAILEADLVVLGPGSLYTSVVPNLLVEGIAKALLQSDALKIYVCNVATQPGETDGYDVAAHVAALVHHMPGEINPIDVVIATLHPPGGSPPQGGVTLVTHAPHAPPRSTGRALRSAAHAGTSTGTNHPRIMIEDVARDDLPLRHDPDKLAVVLMRILKSAGHRRKGSMNGTLLAAR